MTKIKTNIIIPQNCINYQLHLALLPSIHQALHSAKYHFQTVKNKTLHVKIQSISNLILHQAIHDTPKQEFTSSKKYLNELTNTSQIVILVGSPEFFYFSLYFHFFLHFLSQLYFYLFLPFAEENKAISLHKSTHLGKDILIKAKFSLRALQKMYEKRQQEFRC